MNQESLCQQHLPTAQHTAPATVCGPGGALQLRELSPVGQPNPRHKSQTKPLHLVWVEVKEEDETERKKENIDCIDSEFHLLQHQLQLCF